MIFNSKFLYKFIFEVTRILPKEYRKKTRQRLFKGKYIDIGLSRRKNKEREYFKNQKEEVLRTEYSKYIERTKENISFEQFENVIMDDKRSNGLFAGWKNFNYDKSKKPQLCKKNPKLDYSLNNIGLSTNGKPYKAANKGKVIATPTNNYIRKNTYTNVGEILSAIQVEKFFGKKYVIYDGEKVKTGSDRYTLFAKNITCVKCGIKGSFLALERNNDSLQEQNRYWHFNLYALNDKGEEVLMTKDHIIPKSRGGANHISNLQTMCTCCNGEKGNKMEEENER